MEERLETIVVPRLLRPVAPDDRRSAEPHRQKPGRSEHVALIEQAVMDGDGIERIIHMRTLHLGPEELLVAVNIAVSDVTSAAELAAAIDAAEARIRSAVPIARVIYVEPDIYRSAAPLDSRP